MSATLNKQLLQHIFMPDNNTYCFAFRVSEGKLQEVTEYQDTELVTAALGGLKN